MKEYFGYTDNEDRIEINEYYGNETHVVIPEGVQSIEDGAFEDCLNIESLVIPSSVDTIGNAFTGCTRLKTIIVDEKSKFFSVKDGIVFNKSMDEVIKMPNADERKEYAVPEGVKYIGNGAFTFCENLKSIKLPNSIKYIGKAAFSYCSGLTVVVIPDGVIDIDDEAFICCINLRNIIIPDSVEYIGDYVFSCCDSLRDIEIPVNCGKVGSYSFHCCEGIEHIRIPNVEAISDGMFNGCTNLKSVEIPNSVMRIGMHAFNSCTSLKDIVIPDSVEYIADTAFRGCDRINIIRGAKNVEAIEKARINRDSKRIVGMVLTSNLRGCNLKKAYNVNTDKASSTVFEVIKGGNHTRIMYKVRVSKEGQELYRMGNCKDIKLFGSDGKGVESTMKMIYALRMDIEKEISTLK